MAYRFDWDTEKAATNFDKHGIAFHEACTVLGDPLALLMDDPDHSVYEQRYLMLGMSALGRVLVVAFAQRGEMTRIISARRATRRERRRYEEED
ncbi:MAG TPA: BrnT family toxin [bacterium]|nr:BrnT family toxin [bacterium]HQO37084.1 BrnT family toxin [bacterium]HQP98027.1 BrnT family toxin [bacterium]